MRLRYLSLGLCWWLSACYTVGDSGDGGGPGGSGEGGRGGDDVSADDANVVAQEGADGATSKNPAGGPGTGSGVVCDPIEAHVTRLSAWTVQGATPQANATVIRAATIPSAVGADFITAFGETGIQVTLVGTADLEKAKQLLEAHPEIWDRLNTDLLFADWKAKVRAAGHVSERFTMTVPHRGELRGVRVDLVPVREQVFSLYKVAAQPQLPEARLWGVWSPRQIVDHVRRQRPSPALAELTDFVEEAYFSARVPDEDVLPLAQGHVDRAVRERARVASA